MTITKEEFEVVVVGLVKGYRQAFDLAARDFTAHTLAVKCLESAVGPGLDAKTLAEFTKKVETFVTLPVVGFVPLVLRTGGSAVLDSLSGKKTPSILDEAIRTVTGKNKPDKGLARVGVVSSDKVRRPDAVIDTLRRKPKTKLKFTPRLKTVPVGRVFDPTGALSMGVTILAELGPFFGSVQMRQARLVGLDTKMVPRTWRSKVGQVLAKARQPEQLKKSYQRSMDQLHTAWEHLKMATTQMEAHRRALKLPPVSL